MVHSIIIQIELLPSVQDKLCLHVKDLDWLTVYIPSKKKKKKEGRWRSLATYMSIQLLHSTSYMQFCSNCIWFLYLKAGTKTWAVETGRKGLHLGSYEEANTHAGWTLHSVAALAYSVSNPNKLSWLLRRSLEDWNVFFYWDLRTSGSRCYLVSTQYYSLWKILRTYYYAW